MTPWRIDWDLPTRERLALAHRVIETLEHHPSVDRAELFGSLASTEPDGHPADKLSDIDIRVTLSHGTDRDFFEGLEPALAPVGKSILYSIFVSDTAYTRSLMFEKYSPFWHVDLVCRAPLHVPGADVLKETRSERGFGAWLSAAKRFARAGDFLGYFLELAPYAESRHHQPAVLFRDLLHQWHLQTGDDLRRDIGERVVSKLFPT